MKVPFLELLPTYEELQSELDAAYQRVMKSGWYLLGEECEAFESEFADYCGAEHAVAVSTGLDALRISLIAHDIGPGDEVIVPAHTFIATWLGVSECGATPVPVDVRRDTANLDYEKIETAFSSKTKAIIPVHLYGQPADMDPVREFAKSRELAVIEDAAQAHGARYREKKCGSLSECAAFSFYPGKNLGAFSNGGAITTSDADLARRARRLRNYGSERRYYHEEAGGNSRLDELQSAFLRIKLRRLNSWNERRKKIAAIYLERLAGLEGITLPVIANWAESSWHLFVVKANKRDALQAALAEEGIQTAIHYPIPPHLSGAYQEMGLKAGSFPVAEDFGNKALSLPIGPHLSDGAVDLICEKVSLCVARI